MKSSINVKDKVSLHVIHVPHLKNKSLQNAVYMILRDILILIYFAAWVKQAIHIEYIGVLSVLGTHNTIVNLVHVICVPNVRRII